MSTSERDIAGLVSDIDASRLEIAPFFQRRLVWTNRDKEFLIASILGGFPFPEIFIATKSVNPDTHVVTKLLVDGQQRLTTIWNYVKAKGSLLYKTIRPFADLTPSERQAFLHYSVSVRDLGLKTEDEIREIFKRINSTDYSLKHMEVMHALYSGEYKGYCYELSQQPFFKEHSIFDKGVEKRMGDVDFCVNLVTTLLCGYYHRDERSEEFLRRYNDEFPDKTRVQEELDCVFDFVESCKLPVKSRAWKRTDLFSLLIEAHHQLVDGESDLDPAVAGIALSSFYDQVDHVFKSPRAKHPSTLAVSKPEVAVYLKAATKASNDKFARVARGEVVEKVLLKALRTRSRRTRS